MKRLYIILLLFISIGTLLGQEKRVVAIGKVIFQEIPISDVHIVNKNTNIGTITNDKGIFEIPLRVNDSIEFSHINLEKKLVVITKEILSKNRLTIKLVEKTYALEEITLEKPKSIFYVDETITYYEPAVNAKTLNLPYANTKAKKDEAKVKIRSGFVFNVDNIINGINGNTRRKELLQKMSKEDTDLSKIRKHFTDDFFITDLKIKAEYINPFLNYCTDKNIIQLFKKENQMELTQLLIKESKDFPYKIENEDLFLTKN